MNRPTHPRAPLRALLLLASSTLLGACVAEGPSPPRVDVPEPGTAVSRARSGTAAGTGVRVYPSASSRAPQAVVAPSAIPLPAPAGSAAPGPGGITVEGSAEQGAVPVDAPGASAPAPGSAYQIASDHVPARSSNNAVNALLAHADTSRRQGNLDAAIAAAERALRIEPGDPAVYCELALLRLARGDRALAAQLARKGLAQQPEPALRQQLEEILTRATTASG